MMGRWMQMAYEASPLTLRADGQAVATLEIKDASHRFEIREQENGPPRFVAILSAKATIMELVAEKQLEEIQKLAEETIRKEITDYYNKGLDMGADLLHLGQAYYKYHPYRWKRISKNGRLPLTPDSLEKIDVRLIINNAQKYKSPQWTRPYKD